jgi:hypothetical protein
VDGPYLHLVRGRRVILKAIIPLDRHLAVGNIEDYISEAAAVVLVSEGHESFEAFLQVQSIVLDGLVLTPGIGFAVIALTSSVVPSSP